MLRLLLFTLFYSAVLHAVQINIPAPKGSGRFGATTTILPNGNIVVIDTDFDVSPTQIDVGAVYLYNAKGKLISRVTGSMSGDRVGAGNVEVLRNGQFVVSSPSWNEERGAVTWISASNGLNGVVGSANSLVGTSPNDSVGRVYILKDGNYVVGSTGWDRDSITDAGAVTWCSQETGRSGIISAENSLIGTRSGDLGISSFVYPLKNGHYVVVSSSWTETSVGPESGKVIVREGAATWCNGQSGKVGEISSANSLIGGSFFTELENGNYVISGNFESGAVTWCSGTIGRVGLVDRLNSFVGRESKSDRVGDGYPGVVALTNGNYVVSSLGWRNAADIDCGAVTWCDGSTGRIGSPSADNSLTGSGLGDLHFAKVTPLSNGHFVLASPGWSDAPRWGLGAVTWCNGFSETVGVVSITNSLYGIHDSDQVGSTITALPNGNYVIGSPLWDYVSITDVGAVTWASGSGVSSGPISIQNSLIGRSGSDYVGIACTVLSNGNYVVSSPIWDYENVHDAGAITWCSGTQPTTGVVSETNSLVNNFPRLYLYGPETITPLSNGNYVVSIPNWNGYRGAVTWGDGNSGVKGIISEANSLVGSELRDPDDLGDRLGISIVDLKNDNYLIVSPCWNRYRGAVTIASANQAKKGYISRFDSLIGSRENDFVGGYWNTSDRFESTVYPFEDGNYVVLSHHWNNNAGAATYGFGSKGGTVGEIPNLLSLLFKAPNRSLVLQGSFGYNLMTKQLAVGNPNASGGGLVALLSDSAFTATGRPLIVSTEVPPGTVAGRYSWQLKGVGENVRYKVTGLPRGLTCDAATGLISGVPLETGKFRITVSANNQFGNATSVQIELWIKPIARVGAYTAIVSGNRNINAKLGGLLKVTILANGTYSASLSGGAKTFRFTGRVSVNVENASQNFTIIKTLVQPGSLDLLLSLVFDADSANVSGSLGNGVDSVAINGGKQFFSKQRRAIHHMGSMNCVLRTPSAFSADDYPQGYGWLRLSVSESGIVIGSGRTGDGFIITFGSALWVSTQEIGSDANFTFFALFNSNRGSCIGSPFIGSASESDRYVTGTFDWYKMTEAGSNSRFYPKGYDIPEVVIDGSRWFQAKKDRLVMSWEPRAGNMRLELAKGGIDFADYKSSFPQTFSLFKDHRVVFAKSLNLPATTFKVSPQTGFFSGGFKLVDEPLSGSKITREVRYSGLLIPTLNSGVGQFNLSQLPQEGETLKTSPILSGRVDVIPQ